MEGVKNIYCQLAYNESVIKAINALKDVLRQKGLQYDESVKTYCFFQNELYVCQIECFVGSTFKIMTKFARRNKNRAIIGAYRVITCHLSWKFDSEKLCLSENPTYLSLEREKLLTFCKVMNLKYKFINKIVKGLYSARLEVNDMIAYSNGNYVTVTDAEGSASKVWIAANFKKIYNSTLSLHTGGVLSYEELLTPTDRDSTALAEEDCDGKDLTDVHFDDDYEYKADIPSVEQLLKIPERPTDGGKTKDELLDEIDVRIAERKREHELKIDKLDRDIASEKKRQQETLCRRKRNALYRIKLETDLTEDVLRQMFHDNLDYLTRISKGQEESSRHTLYHESIRSRHTLLYSMITDPFTEDQLKWTLEEIGKVWLKSKQEKLDNDEYVWKVLLPECFIKFYMDLFSIDKKEAEKRIRETPLRDDTDSDSDFL